MSTARSSQLRRLWLVALTGPVAWSSYFLAGYSLLEAACRMQVLTAPLGLAGLSAVSVAVLALTAVTVVVILSAGWLALAQWRRLKAAEAGSPQPELEAERFLTVGGLLLSGLFAYLTLATGLPALVLTPCW